MNPRRVFYALLIIATWLLFLFAGVLPAQAQDGGGDSQLFRNGHEVSGEFLAFYNSVADPEVLFGIPITTVFNDPFQPGKRIQYFERVRMELDPAGREVSLANIGEFAYDPARPGIEAPIQPNDPQCRIFPNGKRVCYAFRYFFDRYGEKYIGQPVTNAVFTEDGRLVQYFQHLRMEWRGEMPAGSRVVVTALGYVDFDRRIGDPQYLAPNRGDFPRPIIPTLRAFTGRPLVVNGEKQQVFAILRDQFNEPIKGATVTVTFYYPESGNLQGWSISGISTNDAGYAIAEYDVKGVKPNDVVRVEVKALYSGVELSTSTWFRVWW